MIPNSLRPYILLLLILITAVTAFYPSLQNGFTNWDDPIYVTENVLIKELTLSNLKVIATTYLSGNYHPLTLLTYSIEYSLFGEKPFGYHAVSLVLHLMNCILVFWFIRLLTNNLFITLISCLLFAVHPVKVESVAWIADQKDLLSSLFLLAMLVAYQYYVQNKKAVVLYLSLSFFLLSFLAKANGLTYPFILLLVDYYSNKKVTKNDVIGKIPFFIISFLFGLVAVVARQAYQENLLESMFSVSDTVLLGFHRFIFYFLFRVIGPVSHSWLFPHPHQFFPSTILVISAVVISFAVFISVVLGRIRLPVVFFGWMFFSIALLPALTVVIIGHAADRFTYLPSIGIFLIAAHGVFFLYEKYFSYSLGWKAAMGCTCLAITASLVVVSRQSCDHWKDGIAVWSYAILQHKDFGLAYFNRADSYYHLGKFEQALSDYSQALELDPNYYEIYYHRGLVYQRLRLYDKAISDFSAVILLKPDHYKAYNFRGVAYASRGSIKKAIADYSQAITINPDIADAYHNRGFVYYNLGRTGPACNDLIRACTLGTCNYLGLLKNRGLCQEQN